MAQPATGARNYNPIADMGVTIFYGSIDSDPLHETKDKL